jgi:hypothetical protein
MATAPDEYSLTSAKLTLFNPSFVCAQLTFTGLGSYFVMEK